MGWRNNQYYYSTRILKCIAQSYFTIYEGLSFRNGNLIINPFSLAEYKADFDIALNAIGKGKFGGEVGGNFADYKHFGRLQLIIIADIMGMRDFELEKLGFYDISRLRGFAYYSLCKQLNGE